VNGVSATSASEISRCSSSSQMAFGLRALGAAARFWMVSATFDRSLPALGGWVLNGCLWGPVWSLPAAVSRLYAWS